MVRYATLSLACLLGSAAASFVPGDTSLERRETQVSDDGRLFCGIFGSGSKDNIENLELDLSVGGLRDKQYKIGAGECNRVHCYETTGIYACNDGDKEVTLYGSWIAKGVRCIWNNCCKSDYSGAKYNKGMSGQYFISGMGLNLNIAVGYGNCNDPVNIRPNNALGWGVNPVCMGGVQTPGILSCEV